MFKRTRPEMIDDVVMYLQVVIPKHVRKSLDLSDLSRRQLAEGIVDRLVGEHGRVLMPSMVASKPLESGHGWGNVHTGWSEADPDPATGVKTQFEDYHRLPAGTMEKGND